MVTTSAKKAKAPPRLKYLAVRVTDKEHKAFNRVAKPQGGAAAVLREFVTSTITK